MFHFQNIVAIVMILVRWAIPDMSAELRDKIRREIYITNEIIIAQEAKRAQMMTNNNKKRNGETFRCGIHEKKKNYFFLKT